MNMKKSSKELGKLMAICAENGDKTLPECLKIYYSAKFIYLSDSAHRASSAFCERGGEIELAEI